MADPQRPAPAFPGPGLPDPRSLTAVPTPVAGPVAPEGEDVQPPAHLDARVGRSRTPVYVALVIVAVLAGSALFVSGFTLGAQQATTPGTSDADQARFQPFWEAWNKVTTEYVGELDRKALVEGAIKGMFTAIGDPYSAYMTSEEYRRSLDGLSGRFEGIGAELTTRDDTGDACAPIGDGCRLVVVRVLRRSPALDAGLRIDDQIVAVDGAPVVGSTLEEVVLKVRGEKGTSVTLSLLRGGAPVELRIERDVIETEVVTSRVLADGAVGYLRIDGFSASAAADFRAQLKELVDADVRGIVLDLRNDPGGFVDAALEIASEFIAEGPVYWEQRATGDPVPAVARPGGVATDPDLDLAVLVNGGTASASEIVAAALQDTGRATLVGETTFGKGTIQQWNHLTGDSGGFRLSIAKWLTPDKTWIDGVGIEPDIPVAPAPEGSTADPQLEAAIEAITRSTETGGVPLAA